MQQENDTVRQWSRNAPYWDKYRETIRGMFAPVTRALIADAQIETGHSVLDIATGPGEPALSVAEVVGAGGRVFGIDPASEMIAAARRAASREGKSNVQFEIAFADRLPFRAAEFDAVVSRFGVMFFPSPVDGVREMLRVLKPRHRLAFAVWHFGERNPFHYVLARVIDRYVPPEPVPPDSLEAFRFAAPGKLVNVLNEAGAAEVRERILQFRIEAPGSVDDFWTLRSEMSDKLRAKLGLLSDEQFAAIRSEVSQDLRPYSTEHGISFPAEVVIVSGIKP
jgi:ubiquinone/menaquinone biosynthesis C-methylase UbiE